MAGATHPTTGETLADRYVTIGGNYDAARAAVVRIFGDICDDLYPADGPSYASWVHDELIELPKDRWPSLASPISESFECDACGAKIALLNDVQVELDRDGLSLDMEHECGNEANVAYRWAPYQ